MHSMRPLLNTIVPQEGQGRHAVLGLAVRAAGASICCRTFTTSNGVTTRAVTIDPIEPERMRGSIDGILLQLLSPLPLPLPLPLLLFFRMSAQETVVASRLADDGATAVGVAGDVAIIRICFTQLISSTLRRLLLLLVFLSVLVLSLVLLFMLMLMMLMLIIRSILNLFASMNLNCLFLLRHC